MIPAQTLADSVRKELGALIATEAHNDSDVIRYMNSSVRDVVFAKEFDFAKFSQTVTVVEGTESYQIANAVKTYEVLMDGMKLVKAGRVLRFEDYESLSEPSGYVGIWGETFKSRNAGTYKILYYGLPPVVTRISDGILNVPEFFYDALHARCVSYGLKDLKFYDKAAEKDKQFDAIVDRLGATLCNPLSQAAPRMGSGHKW